VSTQAGRLRGFRAGHAVPKAFEGSRACLAGAFGIASNLSGDDRDRFAQKGQAIWRWLVEVPGEFVPGENRCGDKCWRHAVAVYLTAKRESFCSGGDLNMLINANKPWEVHRRFRHASTVFPPLISLDRPVICGVRGYAVGEGLGLVLMADIIGMSKLLLLKSFQTGIDDLMLYEDLGQVLAMSSAEFIEGLEALRSGRKADHLAAALADPTNDGLPGAEQ